MQQYSVPMPTVFCKLAETFGKLTFAQDEVKEGI